MFLLFRKNGCDYASIQTPNNTDGNKTYLNVCKNDKQGRSVVYWNVGWFDGTGITKTDKGAIKYVVGLVSKIEPVGDGSEDEYIELLDPITKKYLFKGRLVYGDQINATDFRIEVGGSAESPNIEHKDKKMGLLRDYGKNKFHQIVKKDDAVAMLIKVKWQPISESEMASQPDLAMEPTGENELDNKNVPQVSRIIIRRIAEYANL